MRKLNLAIALGVILALVGAAIAFAYGRSVDERIADGKRTTTVLVTTKALTAGMTGAEVRKSVETRDIPAAYAPEGTISSLDDVATKTLLGPVPIGAQLTATDFGRPADLGTIKPTKGNVALAVGVDLVPGVARYIAAPSVVDLFVTYPEKSGEAPSDSRTKLFATGVKVLSVSVAPPPELEEDDEDAATEASTAATDQVVAVLDVRPDEAERIVNAQTLGKLYLGLSTKDDRHPTVDGVTPDDVVQANR